MKPSFWSRSFGGDCRRVRLLRRCSRVGESDRERTQNRGAERARSAAPNAADGPAAPNAADSPARFFPLIGPGRLTNGQIVPGYQFFDNQSRRRVAIDLEDQLIAANPLGIEVTPVEAPLRLHLKLPATEGLIVIKAPPESEGAKAGLRQHDVILRMVDNPVAEVSDFLQVLSRTM